MSRDVRGKVKETVWNRPTCVDQSDRLGARRAARRVFRQDSLAEDGASTSILAPDVFDEAAEFCPNENPFFSEEGESYEV